MKNRIGWFLLLAVCAVAKAIVIPGKAYYNETYGVPVYTLTYESQTGPYLFVGTDDSSALVYNAVDGSYIQAYIDSDYPGIDIDAVFVDPACTSQVFVCGSEQCELLDSSSGKEVDERNLGASGHPYVTGFSYFYTQSGASNVLALGSYTYSGCMLFYWTRSPGQQTVDSKGKAVSWQMVDSATDYVFVYRRIYMIGDLIYVIGNTYDSVTDPLDTLPQGAVFNSSGIAPGKCFDYSVTQAMIKSLGKDSTTAFSASGDRYQVVDTFLTDDHNYLYVLLCSSLGNTGSLVQVYDAAFSINGSFIAPLSTKCVSSTYKYLSMEIDEIVGVIFFGMAGGKIHKYSFTPGDASSISSVHYNNATGEDCVGYLADLDTSNIDPSTQKVYFGSSTAVSGMYGLYSIPFQSCSLRKTCATCLNGDPYCGWCAKENKCSQTSECLEYGVPGAFLPALDGQCPAIESVSPTSIPAGTDTAIVVRMSNSAKLVNTEIYRCKLSGEFSLNVDASSVTYDDATGYSNITCDIRTTPTGDFCDGYDLTISYVSADGKQQYNMASESSVGKVYDCPLLTSSGCDGCIADGDGYCGYCQTQFECSAPSQCVSDIDNSFLTSTCPALVEGVCPLNFSVEETTPLSFRVSTLPNITSQYTCYFESGTDYHNVTATISATGLPNELELTCASPIYDSGSLGGESRTVNMAILFEGKTLFSSSSDTRTKVFDCGVHTDCVSCSNSVFACGWNTDTHLCVHDPTGIYIASAGLCPFVDSVSAVWIDALNNSESLTITGKNLPSATMSNQYKCNFGSPINFATSATLDGGNLVCATPVIAQNQLSNTTGRIDNIALTVTYGDYELPATPALPTLRYYSCSVFDITCLACTSHTSGLNNICGWCDDSCVKNTTSCDTLISTVATCPSASITSISPRSGPLAGGTPLLITGNNLGLKQEDIETLSLAFGMSRYPCQRYTWIDTAHIQCITPRYTSPAAMTVQISITGYSNLITLNDTFQYVPNPTITKVAPIESPIAGGITVTISGTNLDSGSSASLKIGTVPCTFINRTSTQFFCETRSTATATTATVKLTIDGATAQGPSFAYRSDPTLTNITNPESPASGGVTMVVTGDNLDSAVPVVNFHFEQPSNDSRRDVTIVPCGNIQYNSTVLTCVTPEGKANTQASISLQLGNALVYAPTNVTYYPDPSISDFNPTEGSVGGGTTISIVGTNMMRGAIPSITVVGYPCTFEPNDASNEYIKCITTKGKGEGILSLRYGNAVANSTGIYSYVTISSFATLADWVIPVVVVLAVIFIVALIVGVVFIRKHLRGNNKQTKALFADLDKANEEKMDVLSDVMVSYQGDGKKMSPSNPSYYATVSIPFNDLSRYMTQVAFRPHESFTLPPEWKPANKKQADAYQALLKNPEFAVILARSLEAQTALSASERKAIGANLFLAAQGDFDAATKVVLGLLGDLIDAKVGQHKVKEVLDGSSLIVERAVAAWLAYGLYDYLKGDIARQLFVLMAAIRAQVYIGAVDGVLGYSQFTINAATMLRGKVSYERIKIRAVCKSSAMEDVEICTSDCPSIVVRVIMNAVEGSSVRADEMGLFDEHGKQLRDVDDSSSQEDGRTVVNTMAHFKIVEGAILKVMTATQKVTHPLSPGKDVHLEVGSEVDAKSPPSEVLFTRLTTMKEMIHKPVDKLMELLYAKKTIPQVVKQLFDFLDGKARAHGITDKEVVETWKGRALFGAALSAIVRDPEILFQVDNAAPIRNCLVTISDVLAESALPTRDTDDSRASFKMLYRNELKDDFKKLAESYYAAVASETAASTKIPSEKLNGSVADSVASFELLGFTKRFKDQIAPSLAGSPLEASFQSATN